MNYIYLFCLLLFVVAFLYASVGHGGASGYLALMVVFGVAPDVMKPTALLLNLFVSLTAFIQFYRGRHFQWKLFLPFAITSVPMAYWGGLTKVEASDYKKILGVLLLLPVSRLLFFPNTLITRLRKANMGLSLIIGTVIGFLSGLIGIGGGIILSPVLLLLKWADQKQTAAISALFIFVNSLSGLAGQMKKGIHFTSNMLLFVGVAFAGGLIGSYFGAIKFSHQWLKYILATVLLFASYKLLFKAA
jgi:hypothetical protein